WLYARSRTGEIGPLVEKVLPALLADCKSDSDRSDLALSTGQLYTAVGLPELAMRHYQQAMRWQPSARSAFALAAALHACGRTGEIGLIVETVLQAQLADCKSDADRSILALSTGQQYTAVGLPELAMKHYQQAMRWQPSAKPAIALAAALQN